MSLSKSAIASLLAMEREMEQLRADKAELLAALAQSLPILERLRTHGPPDSLDCDCHECTGRGASVAEVRALIAKHEAKP